MDSNTSEKQLTFDDIYKRHDNNFDFLRVLLAIFVIFAHCFLLLGLRNISEPLGLITHQQIHPGEFAVNAFFIISGFLITASMQRSKTILSYLLKRVKRIYPGFIAASLFSVLVVGALGAPDVKLYLSHLSIGKILIRILFLSNIKTPPTFINQLDQSTNGAIWTIKYEFICYLLVILFYVTGLLKNRIITLWITSLTIVYFGFVSLKSSQTFGTYDFVLTVARFTGYFLSGMCIYLYKEKIPYSNKIFLLFSTLVIISALTTGLGLTLGLFGAYIILYIAYQPKIKLSNFGKYGDFSYGIYLYGWPMQQLVIHYCGTQINPYVLFFYSVLLAAIFAFVSWHSIEKPFLNRKHAS